MSRPGLKFRRTDSAESSTLHCACGATISFSEWGAELDAWQRGHEAHLTTARKEPPAPDVAHVRELIFKLPFTEQNTVDQCGLVLHALAALCGLAQLELAWALMLAERAEAQTETGEAGS